MMRMKFFSAFLGVLMISGLFAPLIMVNNSIGYEEIKPVEVMQISDTLDTWHHDCSNTSLFDQYLDWPMNWWWETYTVSGGTMFSDGASLSFSDITYASPDWYGPIFVHNITEPFTLDNFEEFTVELDIDNTDTSDAGIMSVYLCDANYMPVIRVFCSDSWDWRSYGHNRAEYRFSNGSYVYHGNTDYITWTLLNDSISIWSEPNGDLYAEVPGFGSSLLLKSEFIEHDREIHHIVIQTGRLSSYSWMPSLVRDIKYTIDSSPVTNSLSTWHHDCSNTTGLIRNTTWPLDDWLSGVNEWTITDGDMLSSGDHLYFTGIPSSSSGWHGPAFVHILENPLSLNHLENFVVQLDVDNSATAYAGKIQVLLMDSNQRPVVRAYIGDAWNGVSEGQIFAEYMQPDGTYYRHGMITVATFTEFNGLMSFNYSNTTGVSASVTGYGDTVLYSPNTTEAQREITHILILTGRLAGYTYMPSMIDDIYLQWIPEDSEPGIANDSISVDSPDDIVYTVGATGNEITWTPLSTIPDSFELFVDGELVDSGSWDGSVISINVDGLAPWIYNYSIYVNNTEGESVTDWVLVTVTGAGSTGGFDYLIISISIGSMLVIVVIIGAICRNRGPGSTSVPSSGYEW